MKPDCFHLLKKYRIWPLRYSRRQHAPQKIVLHYDNEYGEEEEEVQHVGVKLLNETGEQNNIKSSILTHFVWGFLTLRTELTTG